MGGNAIQNIRRYDAFEYHQLVEEVLSKLQNIFPGHRIEVLKSFRNKESFGDMDILLESFDFQGVNFKEIITNQFNSKQIVHNGNCYSFEFKDFQIDLILFSSNHYETARNYYAWNDLGNFLGRVCKRFDLKLGFDGLICVFRDNTYEFAEVPVSTNFRDILLFLGYDPIEYENGFDSLEDIFKYAASSPFFNKEIFAYHNRNHTARTRDRKRKNYREFLIWLETRNDLPEYNWSSLSELGGISIPKENLNRIFTFFPEFEPKYYETMEQFNLWRKAKEIFNGQIVRELTGLTDRELGKFMQYIKLKIPKREILVNMLPEQVAALVNAEYEEYKKNNC